MAKLVIDWDKGRLTNTPLGPRVKVVFRVPKWARELYDERTLKVIAWMELGKPPWMDPLEQVEIVPQEEVTLLEE